MTNTRIYRAGKHMPQPVFHDRIFRLNMPLNESYAYLLHIRPKLIQTLTDDMKLRSARLLWSFIADCAMLQADLPAPDLTQYIPPNHRQNKTTTAIILHKLCKQPLMTAPELIRKWAIYHEQNNRPYSLNRPYNMSLTVTLYPESDYVYALLHGTASVRNQFWEVMTDIQPSTDDISAYLTTANKGLVFTLSSPQFPEYHNVSLSEELVNKVLQNKKDNLQRILELRLTERLNKTACLIQAGLLHDDETWIQFTEAYQILQKQDQIF